MVVHYASMAAEPVSESIVLIGASYAEGWPIEQISGTRVVNTGIGGQQSHEMLARFGQDVLGEAPRGVIIWGFINDIFGSSPQGVEARLARTREDTRRMVELAEGHGIQPVLATEILMARPRGPVYQLRSLLGRLRGKTSYREWVNAQVRSTNVWLRHFGERRGIRVLDFEAVLAGPDGWRDPLFATADGSHVSPAGYDALSAYVERRAILAGGR